MEKLIIPRLKIKNNSQKNQTKNKARNQKPSNNTTKKIKTRQINIFNFHRRPPMQYGLNNNLGSANSITDRTQSSAFVNNKQLNKIKGAFEVYNILAGFQNGKTGGERIQGLIKALLSGGK